MNYLQLLYGLGLLVLPAVFADQYQVQAPLELPTVNASLVPVPPDCASAKGLARVVCLADAFRWTC